MESKIVDVEIEGRVMVSSGWGVSVNVYVQGMLGKGWSTGIKLELD
jgi:hypothetical protein